MSFETEKLRTLTHLLVPSAAGLIVYVIISLFTLLLQTVPVLQQYLQLSENWLVSQLILTQLGTFLLFLFGTSLTNIIVLSIFWAVVGLVVYFGLHGIVAFISEVGLDVHDEQNIQPIGNEPQAELRRAIERGALRLAMVVVAVVYVFTVLWFFVKGDVPTGSALGRLFAEHPSIQAFGMFVGQCLALHGLTVILRLMTLKSRLLD